MVTFKFTKLKPFIFFAQYHSLNQAQTNEMIRRGAKLIEREGEVIICLNENLRTPLNSPIPNHVSN